MDNENKIKLIKQWLATGSINIFGLPFAGKDTQGKILAIELNASLIGGGDILRSNGMPEHIKDYMLTGELTPTDEYVSIVIPYLSREVFTGKPIVLNSVGRWHGEEDYVVHATKASNHPLKAVIELKLSEDIVIQRWQELPKIQDRGNRYDDTREILENRLKQYKEKTQPVIENYKSMGLCTTIDASKSRESVHEDIINALYNLASRDEA
jgi:adenylate kinase